MTNTESITQKNLPNLLKKHRKKLSIAAGALVVYAVSGFFLVPWVIKSQMVDAVAETFNAELRVEQIAFNPFALSLRISGLAIDDPDGAPVASLAEFIGNFQASSLFRWAYTLREVTFVRPELHVARDAEGALNLQFLIPADGERQPSTTPERADGLIRAIVQEFAIREAVVNWRDRIPNEPVDTRFGPVNIAISNLNTLPQGEGHQDVTIATESGGVLAWRGTVSLNPIMSAGHASVIGSHMPLASQYLKHETGLDIVNGDAEIEFDYRVSTRADGSVAASVSNLDLGLNNLIVKTFEQNAEGNVAGDQVVRLPRLALMGGNVRYPEQVMSVARMSLEDAAVALIMSEAGELNVVRSVSAASGDATGGQSPGKSNGESAWQWSVDEFAINNLSFVLDDRSIEPAAVVGLDDFDLTIRDISNTPDARFPLQATLTGQAGSTLSLDGEVGVFPQPFADLGFGIDSLVLSIAHPYIAPIADLSLDSGTLNVDGRLRHSPTDMLQFEGSARVADLSIVETDEGTQLGGWQSLQAANITYSNAMGQLEISEISIDQPFGDVLITEDGSLNLGRIDTVDASTDPAEPVPAAASEPAVNNNTLQMTIGRVVIKDAMTNFTDLSLPLPFSAKIEGLSGEMTTIATASNEPSTVDFEGAVDEYGFVRVTGSVTPLDPTLNTDLAVVFQNINVPKFSAYSIPFAGREIASGSLDLDLGYRVEDAQLAGENKIVLSDLELGDAVEHPDAASLPLGLAVALLKGPDGKIDLDLPVNGDVNDPEFSYGSVVWTAFSNLIIKIVASPFALLGNLIGVEPNELEHINFIEGRSDLTPPEQQRVARLVEALTLRPELLVEIGGVAAPTADGLALRAMRVEEKIESGIASPDVDGAQNVMYAAQRRIAIETLFDALRSTQPELTERATIIEQFTTLPGTDPDESSVLDELAYVNELQRLLIESEPLPDEALAILARERADSLRIALVGADPLLESRIIEKGVEGVSAEPGEPVPMRVTLSVGDSALPNEEATASVP